MDRHHTLVLGIGNLLWADEGFGVRCVERLTERFALPADVQALDGGTQGLYLLPFVQACDRLVIFDAIDYGLPPGTLRTVRDDEVPRFMGARKMSLHQTGFQEVIAAAMLTGQCPGELLLIGAQPVELEDFGGSLRPELKACIDPAVDLAVAQLRAWGHGLGPRAHAPLDALARPDASLALAAYEQGRPSAEQACRVGDARVLGERR